MKISLQWVEEIIGRPIDRKKVIDLLNMKLGAIESVLETGPLYSGIKVAEIKEAKMHPDAEKLGIYQVDLGSNATVQVVAGDRHLKAGDKVAYVPPGAVVPSTACSDHPLKIEKRTLRGVESDGMLASEQEMGFSSEGGGVMVLPPDVAVGAEIEEALSLSDTILEIENKALTQRPDCFGMLGIAREVATFLEYDFIPPEWYQVSPVLADFQGEGLKLSVDNHIPELCPRYMARAFDNIQIAPSTLKDKIRLSFLGIRPQSNIVDLTNLIMYYIGQPVHAFDYDKIGGSTILIRHPLEREKIRLLNGQEVELDQDSILIADQDRPLAIAGVMGGEDSEVSPETKRVVIEVANFDMYRIRNATMKYGITSEAATRYARSQSAAQCQAAMAWIEQSMTKSLDARIASAVIDAYPQKDQSTSLSFDSLKINRLLGLEVTIDQIAAVLKRQGFIIKDSGTGGTIQTEVPFWRKDINLVEDIAEEIGRNVGYEKVSARFLQRDNQPQPVNELLSLTNRCRRIMIAAGGNEVLTYSAISQQEALQAGWDPKIAFRIRNCRSPKLEYLRMSLLPSLLAKTHWNHRQGYTEFLLFEINPVHSRSWMAEDGLPRESTRLSAVFSADKKGGLKYHGAAFFEAKSYLTNLLDSLGIESIHWQEMADDSSDFRAAYQCLMSGRRAMIVSADSLPLGVIGEPSAAMRKAHKLSEFCAVFEIALDGLAKTADRVVHYQKLARYPAVYRDATYIITSGTDMDEIVDGVHDELRKIPYLDFDLAVADIYQPPESDVRHVTLNLKIWNKKATLTTEETAVVMDRISQRLMADFKAKVI